MKTITRPLLSLLVICSLFWLSTAQAEPPLYTVTFNIPVPFATVSFAGTTNPMGNYVFHDIPEGTHYYHIVIPCLNPVSGAVTVFYSMTVGITFPFPYYCNFMKVNDISGTECEDITVDLYIYNSGAFTGFNADIHLPEWFGFIFGQIQLNPARKTNHEITGTMLMGTNILRIISFSPTNAAYLGSSGVIASFGLTTTPPYAGISTLVIDNAAMTNSAGTNIINHAFPGIVTLEQGILPGDSNCDCFVNALDLISTINYLMGMQILICFENADVNGDSKITIADVVGTLNIILN